MDKMFEISNEAKCGYLKSLIGKLHKVLHLFEERSTTGYSPAFFISGQMFEIQAANDLFHGKLTPIIIKLKGIYDNADTITNGDVKRHIFESVKIVKALLNEVETEG